jgi:hypothetical protein
VPKVSIVVCTYRRLANIERILQAWLQQTPDVWLADSSGKFQTKLPINHVRFSPDPGNKARHAVSLFTHGDFVIKADDDVMPKPGLIEAFLDYSYLDGILGLMGRTFHGPKYYGNTKVVRAREISAPQKVDMVGILTFTPRKYLAFDLKDCHTSIEDLFWHMKIYPHITKHVIPTNKYEQLPESNDKGCLFKNKTARIERENFYSKYYRMNYE